MKRLLVAAAACLLFATALIAENISYSALTPKTAKSMALGGAFSSVPTAEFSFFGNPAAFAEKKATFFFPSVDIWTYLRPSFANLGSVTENTGNTGALLSSVFSLMAQNGGIGAGLSAGFGYAGKGLGIGVFATTDEFIAGTSPASAKLHSDTEASVIFGLGFPLQLGDSVRLSVGGDLRPFYRVKLLADADKALPGVQRTDIALADILTSVSDGSDVLDSLYGDAFFGVALDLGATIQLGALTAGLSVRDIAPPVPITTETLNNLGDSLSAGGSSGSSASQGKAVFLPNITAGLSWAPTLIPRFIEPVLYCEIQDPVAVIQNSTGAGAFWNLFHAGAEIKLLSFITARGGINRGWISAGAGIKLLFLDVNAAIFTEELGALPGDKPRSGLALQTAIRF